MDLRHIFEAIVTGLDLRSTGKWFVYSSLVGVVGGLGAIAFQYLCQLVSHYVLGGLSGYSPPELLGEVSWFDHQTGDFSVWLVVLVLTGGGLVSGWLVFTFAPDAEGHGTDAAIEAYHQKRAVIPPRVPLVKMLASALTIGTGGSAGVDYLDRTTRYRIFTDLWAVRTLLLPRPHRN